jgi:DNA (cytosine-5)-methyltransferase 1
MKLMSLFDGSGGFPLAASLCGIEPVYAAEVEPYPIAVTKNRFPKMKHLGDVSKVKGGEIEPVDIITFGSPCQDMSIAGKRAGLKHADMGDDETTRSGLFLEAIRIIKEMREATNGVYPRYAIWENVPGAFSSNRGEDFRTVLEEFIRVKEKDAVMPDVPKAGWSYADCYSGNGWSLAYRVFDAQYWGVPQRRRRIYLVADFRGQRAGEILLKPEGLRRNSAQSGTHGQETARCAKNSVGTAIGGVDRYNQSFLPGVVYCLQGNGIDRADTAGCNSKGWKEDTSYTLNTIDKPAVVCAQKSYTEFKDESTLSTLKANGGTYGGGSENIVVKNYIVRRLTPTECARLQGFPSWWGIVNPVENLTDEDYAFWLDVRNTYAEINGKATKEYTREQMLAWYNKLHSDSAEYKMWGNGIALPNALYVMQGIAEVVGVHHSK